jgi:hypothetical protein
MLWLHLSQAWNTDVYSHGLLQHALQIVPLPQSTSSFQQGLPMPAVVAFLNHQEEPVHHTL